MNEILNSLNDEATAEEPPSFVPLTEEELQVSLEAEQARLAEEAEGRRLALAESQKTRAYRLLLQNTHTAGKDPAVLACFDKLEPEAKTFAREQIQEYLDRKAKMPAAVVTPLARPPKVVKRRGRFG